MGSQCLCVFMKLEAERRLEAFIEFVEAGEVLGGAAVNVFMRINLKSFYDVFFVLIHQNFS